MPAAKARRARSRLTVAVTGPTGEIGQSLISALERSPEIAEIRGMARRPFDVAARGWSKFDYRRGDVLDPAAVRDLVEGADVVVHLAFVIMGGPAETRSVNLQGSRNLFEATVAAGVKRLVYASSVAAYGFHRENPQPLTEDVPARGSEQHYYSAQKAEVERTLSGALAGARTQAYVFRPCIVGGPSAHLLIDSLPQTKIAEHLPAAMRRLLGEVPLLEPVLPDPGVEFQLVHQDDVASAMRSAVLGRGTPGAYNLAGSGRLTISTLAAELGWHSIPVPRLAVGAAAQVASRVGFLPPQAQWVSAFSEPVIMSTAKARRELGWRPRHSALETLRETIAGARGRG